MFSENREIIKNKNLLLKVFTTLVLYVYCIKNEFKATAILVEDKCFEQKTVIDRGEKFN